MAVCAKLAPRGRGPTEQPSFPFISGVHDRASERGAGRFGAEQLRIWHLALLWNSTTASAGRIDKHLRWTSLGWKRLAVNIARGHVIVRHQSGRTIQRQEAIRNYQRVYSAGIREESFFTKRQTSQRAARTPTGPLRTGRESSDCRPSQRRRWLHWHSRPCQRPPT